MIIEEQDKLIDYLYDMKISKIEPKSEKQMAREFVNSFNQEAKKQNSKWFAKMDNLKKFISLHISKKTIRGVISLHIGCYKYHYSFVDNDYILTDYAKQKSDRLFKLLPEVKSVLEKIPQVFFILKQEECSQEHMEKQLNEIRKQINEIKQSIEK